MGNRLYLQDLQGSKVICSFEQSDLLIFMGTFCFRGRGIAVPSVRRKTGQLQVHHLVTTMIISNLTKQVMVEGWWKRTFTSLQFQRYRSGMFQAVNVSPARWICRCFADFIKCSCFNHRFISPYLSHRQQMPTHPVNQLATLQAWQFVNGSVPGCNFLWG